jgi:hypothetical protein
MPNWTSRHLTSSSTRNETEDTTHIQTFYWQYLNVYILTDYIIYDNITFTQIHSNCKARFSILHLFILKSSVLWDILLPASYWLLARLIFDREDGGDIMLRYIQQGRNLLNHRCENVKSYIIYTGWLTTLMIQWSLKHGFKIWIPQSKHRVVCTPFLVWLYTALLAGLPSCRATTEAQQQWDLSWRTPDLISTRRLQSSIPGNIVICSRFTDSRKRELG